MHVLFRNWCHPGHRFHVSVDGIHSSLELVPPRYSFLLIEKPTRRRSTRVIWLIKTECVWMFMWEISLACQYYVSALNRVTSRVAYTPAPRTSTRLFYSYLYINSSLSETIIKADLSLQSQLKLQGSNTSHGSD